MKTVTGKACGVVVMGLKTREIIRKLLLNFVLIISFRKYVRDLLLPAETTVQEKWLPAETVSVILLPAETLGRKQNHTDSLCRKQEIVDSLGGSQILRTVSARSEN